MLKSNGNKYIQYRARKLFELLAFKKKVGETPT